MTPANVFMFKNMLPEEENDQPQSANIRQTDFFDPEEIKRSIDLPDVEGNFEII